MRWMALVCILLLLAVGIGEKTEHFNVKYEDMRYLTPGTGKVLENAYKKVNGYLGSLPDSIKVVVVNSEKMDEIGKHVEAFSAWNRESSTIVLRDETLKDKESLGVVTTHEICHLGINNILDEKDDGGYEWMEEGVCMVISDEPLDDGKISRYIVNKGFMNTTEIAKAIDSDKYDVTKNGYLQSFSLCRYIEKTYGMQALIDILKSSSPDFKEAFKKRTGKNFDEFYPEWTEYVKSKAAEKPGAKVVTIKGYLDLSMAEA